MLNWKQFITDKTVCLFGFNPHQAQDAITQTFFFFFLFLTVFVKNHATLLYVQTFQELRGQHDSAHVPGS